MRMSPALLLRQLLALVSMLLCFIRATSAPSPCASDPNLLGYSNKTILNEDIVKRPENLDDGSGTGVVYTICPGTTFRFTKEMTESLYVHGNNIVLKCGEDGSSQNNCLLESSASGVRTMLVVFGNNTILQGLTFRDSDDALIEFRGGVASIYNTTVLRDCHFENLVAPSGNDQPLISVGSLTRSVDPPPPDLQKSVRFEDCTFRDNTGWSQLVSVSQDENSLYDVTLHNTFIHNSGPPTNGLAMIRLTGTGGSLTVSNSVIRCSSSGRPKALLQAGISNIRVDKSCFVGTNSEEAIVMGLGDPEVVTTTNTNYVEPASFPRCAGIQVLSSGDGKSTETCYDFQQAQVCPLEGQDASPCPTEMPTMSPTATAPPVSGSFLREGVASRLTKVGFLLFAIIGSHSIS